ncbi:hypothetical protein H4W32_005874 [Actinophytocola algeriensis]|uniref:Uncharacterized protein n=1 Tax=Actinophytocola algeriensis TaxID=1768010 RepID=A0A7W7Q3I6_9PSEU|nr:hypothetical protein [Actinophytocola algeriensis]MBE1477832.1 hypothetical protein [Actinophytocola algeriensis]
MTRWARRCRVLVSGQGCFRRNLESGEALVMLDRHLAGLAG